MAKHFSNYVNIAGVKEIVKFVVLKQLYNNAEYSAAHKKDCIKNK